MRQNPSSVGSPGLPTRLSVTGTLLVAVLSSLGVVSAALALLYPVLTTAFIAGGATAYLASAVLRRYRATGPRNGLGVSVRIPFTDRSLDV